jgi:hypothetical protein
MLISILENPTIMNTIKKSLLSQGLGASGSQQMEPTAKSSIDHVLEGR